MAELERKAKENRRLASAASVKFRKICADMRIDGAVTGGDNDAGGGASTRIESKICRGLWPWGR